MNLNNINNIDLQNIKINKTRRFQLIKPVISHNIYETTSVKKASKMCFKEVSSFNNPNFKNFTIRDIDTNEMFTYKIHNLVKNVVQTRPQLRINPTIPEYDKNDINNLIHINSHSNGMSLIPQLGGNPEEDGKQIVEQIQEVKQEIEKIENKEEVNKIDFIEVKLENVNLKIDNMEKKITEIEKIINQRFCEKKEDSCIIC